MIKIIINVKNKLYKVIESIIINHEWNDTDINLFKIELLNSNKFIKAIDISCLFH